MNAKNRIPEMDLAPQASLPAPAGLAPRPAPQASRRTMFHAFWRHRWWIVVATLAGVVGSYVYLRKQTRVYSAFSRIYISENTTGVLGASGIDQPTGVATQMEIIRSTPLLTSVLERVKDLSIFKTSVNPLLTLRKGLQVAPGSAPDLVTIIYEGVNPVEAAQVANAVVDSYVEFTSRQKKNTAAEAMRLLQNEKQKLETELRDKQNAIEEFKRAHGTYSFSDEKGNITQQEFFRLSEMLTTARIETSAAKWNYETVLSLKDKPAELIDMARADMPREGRDVSINLDPQSQGQMLDARLAQESNALRDQVDQQERNITRLLLTHTPEHILVQEANAELAMLKKQLTENDQRIERERLRRQEQYRQDKERETRIKADLEQGRQQEADKQMVDTFVARAQRRYEGAKKHQEDIEQAFEDQKKLAIGMNATAAEFAKLDDEYKQTLMMWETLANRIKTINVTEDTRDQVNVSILEVARPSFIPVRPDKPRTIAAGLLLGLVLGCGMAFGLDLIDERFHSADEVMMALDSPILGIIPHIVGNEPAPVRGRQVALEPMSDVAEAYRTIRTAIYFAIRNEAGKRLLITSPAPGDGKTTTTTNIAIAMAQAGRRVLLIDADFRKPTVHKVFALSSAVGLTSIMLGEAPRERAIHPSGIENLDVLPCGPVPSNPAEILNGQGFLDLLEGLDRLYDHIIIDSPPVVPVTDARILGALCDDTILVLRAQKSTRRLSQHAAEGLVSVGTRILGVVVNDVPRRRDGYGYYYGYGNGYRYYQYGYGEAAPQGGRLLTAESADPAALPTDASLRLKA